MTMVRVLNRIASKLGHLCALPVEVEKEFRSIWELQGAWTLNGAHKNCFYLADGHPELTGIAGWREEMLPYNVRLDEDYPGTEDYPGIYHRSGTGRLRISAWERYRATGYLDQYCSIEIWAGSPEPRQMVLLTMKGSVCLRTGGATHCSPFYLANDKTTEEDLTTRADRLADLLWIDDEFGIDCDDNLVAYVRNALYVPRKSPEVGEA